MNDEPGSLQPSGERRLAAIVFTDVAGYSAHMQRDETGTLARVRADFERMRVLCTGHGGEVLKSTGDGLLLYFASVVQAVAWGLQIQAEFAARPPEALRHRIGVHLGDVFREAGDVAGDGVNIAARLQTKAQPGAICFSQSVYDAVKGKLPMLVAPLGPQQFKNITEPITVYLATPTGSAVPGQVTRRSRRAAWLAGAALLIAAALGVFFGRRIISPAAPPPPTATPTPAPVGDKSLAVLPFTNMSDEKDTGFFADGMHEDVLTNLANISALKVISRTSVMQYRATTKTIRQIATELGVHYVLEGSVRRAGSKVRVTGQLIDARTDGHLWAKTYDREHADIFATQAELAREILLALQAVLSPADKTRLEQRPTQNMEAYDLYLRARDIFGRGGNLRDAHREAQGLLEQALKLDPKFALAWAYLGRVLQGSFVHEGRAAAQLAAATAAFDRADLAVPDLIEVLLGRLELARYRNDDAGMSAQVERIARLYPNRAESCLARSVLARKKLQWAEALVSMREALLLDPKGTSTLVNYLNLLIALRRYDEAEVINDRLLSLQQSSLLRAFHRAQLTLWAHGTTREFDRLLASIPERDRLNVPEAISAQARIAFTRGDAAAMVKLWRDTGPRWRFGSYTTRTDLFTVATALIVLGRRDEARPLLQKNREQLVREINEGETNAANSTELAVVLALLGEKESARAAKHRAESLAVLNQLDVVGLVLVEAWLGNKGASLEEIARSLRTAPSVPDFGNVNEMRHNLMFWPLQGDPRFEALLNDPKNNTPLF